MLEKERRKKELMKMNKIKTVVLLIVAIVITAIATKKNTNKKY